MAVSRYQAEQGQTVRLGVKFEDELGQLYDPASIASVEILDADKNVLATKSGADIVNDAVGVYYVDWAIPAAETLGKHYDRWNYTPLLGGDAALADLEFIVYQAGTFGVSDYYLSVADAKANCLSGTTLSDSDVQFLIRVTMAIIDRICGQHFVPVEETRYFDGSGSFYLKMNEPWQEISAIVDRDNPSSTYTVSDFRTKGSWIVHKDYLPWPETSFLEPRFACGINDATIFIRGHKNIGVTAKWGRYATCPEPIQHAACVLLMHAARYDRLDGAFIANMKQESAEGYLYTLREVYQKAVINNQTGYPDVDGILVNYRRMSLGSKVI